ncbi:DUF427 domain-containing protein [Jiangella gansuensis]|uniref:DUF427 domain-containing protein n=1 Tax=Jiangella gansuensis TaxID=281473 RepID=UPI000479E282|nr:DUF427 domain-containing protein [Jiangella gansuensis]
MGIRVSEELVRGWSELRYEPTAKRVRARVGGQTWVDSTRAVLVWEPGRIVPSYAVPDSDIDADLLPALPGDAPFHPVSVSAGGPPVLDPRTEFAAHTCAGEPLSLRRPQPDRALVLDGAGFRPADAGLADMVALDFAIFDEWLEEDEPIVGHPRDPFKRIDVRRSGRRVVVGVGGVTLADSTRAQVLFETWLPPRFYLPRDDVRMDLLEPSTTRTTCAYKGHAAYFSATVDGHTHRDLAWTYAHPLSDATQVCDHVAFFNERVDVNLDGEPLSRPVTPWS